MVGLFWATLYTIESDRSLYCAASCAHVAPNLCVLRSLRDLSNIHSSDSQTHNLHARSRELHKRVNDSRKTVTLRGERVRLETIDFGPPADATGAEHISLWRSRGNNCSRKRRGHLRVCAPPLAGCTTLSSAYVYGAPQILRYLTVYSLLAASR